MLIIILIINYEYNSLRFFLVGTVFNVFIDKSKTKYFEWMTMVHGFKM